MPLNWGRGVWQEGWVSIRTSTNSITSNITSNSVPGQVQAQTTVQVIKQGETGLMNGLGHPAKHTCILWETTARRKIASQNGRNVNIQGNRVMGTFGYSSCGQGCAGSAFHGQRPLWLLKGRPSGLPCCACCRLHHTCSSTAVHNKQMPHLTHA